MPSTKLGSDNTGGLWKAPDIVFANFYWEPCYALPKEYTGNYGLGAESEPKVSDSSAGEGVIDFFDQGLSFLVELWEEHDLKTILWKVNLML